MPRPRPRLQGWPVAAAIAVLALVPFAASSYYLHLLTLTFVYGIMAMSLALLVTAAAAGAMYLLTVSPFGLALRGIRESESRMRVLGYDVWLHKYLVFVIAGAFCGVGGTVYAFYNGFVSPTDVSLVASANALLMVILGGTGTLFGSVVGSALLVFLQNLLSGITQRWLTVLGAILVLAVIYAPAGIVGAGQVLARRLGTPPRGHAVAAPTAGPNGVGGA